MPASPTRAPAPDVTDLDAPALLVRWPDGTDGRLALPALVRDHLLAGERYDVAELLDRGRVAVMRASYAVQRQYGFPCPRAAAQLAELERTTARFRAEDRVLVLALPQAAGRAAGDRVRHEDGVGRAVAP